MQVAFEKAPATGFYDVGDEKQRTKELGQEFRPQTLEELEGKRRKVSVKGLEQVQHTFKACSCAHVKRL